MKIQNKVVSGMKRGAGGGSLFFIHAAITRIRCDVHPGFYTGTVSAITGLMCGKGSMATVVTSPIGERFNLAYISKRPATTAYYGTTFGSAEENPSRL